MNSVQKMLLVSGVLFSVTGYFQPVAAAQADQPLLPKLAAAEEESPAQQRIAAATQQLKADAKKVQAYNELAIAFLRRARETADASYLNQADDALAQGLKLDSTDFQLLRTRVALMLSRHQFAQARELASALHHRVPDDVMTYGYLAESDIG